MRDTNSSGILKFGEYRGTLGKAIPGRASFVPRSLNSMIPGLKRSWGSRMWLWQWAQITLDKIIINLSSLAKDMFKYVHSLVTKHTSLQVFLPVVLPICADNSPINTRIQDHNNYLHELCISHPKLAYIEANVFKKSKGSLKPNRTSGPSDPLHVSAEGCVKNTFVRAQTRPEV